MTALMNGTVNALIHWHSEHIGSCKVPAKVIQYVFEMLPNSESFRFSQFINYLVAPEILTPISQLNAETTHLSLHKTDTKLR